MILMQLPKIEQRIAILTPLYKTIWCLLDFFTPTKFELNLFSEFEGETSLQIGLK